MEKHDIFKDRILPFFWRLFKKIFFFCLIIFVFVFGFIAGEYKTNLKTSRIIAGYNIIYSGKNVEALMLFKTDDPVSEFFISNYSKTNLDVLNKLLETTTEQQLTALKLMTNGLKAAITTLDNSEADKKIKKTDQEINTFSRYKNQHEGAIALPLFYL